MILFNSIKYDYYCRCCRNSCNLFNKFRVWHRTSHYTSSECNIWTWLFSIELQYYQPNPKWVDRSIVCLFAFSHLHCPLIIIIDEEKLFIKLYCNRLHTIAFQMKEKKLSNTNIQVSDGNITPFDIIRIVQFLQFYQLVVIWAKRSAN